MTRKGPESQTGKQSKRFQAETQLGPGNAPRSDAVLETKFDWMADS